MVGHQKLRAETRDIGKSPTATVFGLLFFMGQIRPKQFGQGMKAMNFNAFTLTIILGIAQ